MKKFLKWFLGITAACSVVGLLIAYFCRDNENDELDDYDDYEDDEDFDLDNDLKPVENREYVPLNKTEDSEAKVETEEAEEVKETAEVEETEEADDAEEKTEE